MKRTTLLPLLVLVASFSANADVDDKGAEVGQCLDIYQGCVPPGLPAGTNICVALATHHDFFIEVKDAYRECEADPDCTWDPAICGPEGSDVDDADPPDGGSPPTDSGSSTPATEDGGDTDGDAGKDPDAGSSGSGKTAKEPDGTTGGKTAKPAKKSGKKSTTAKKPKRSVKERAARIRNATDKRIALTVKKEVRLQMSRLSCYKKDGTPKKSPSICAQLHAIDMHLQAELKKLRGDVDRNTIEIAKLRADLDALTAKVDDHIAGRKSKKSKKDKGKKGKKKDGKKSKKSKDDKDDEADPDADSDAEDGSDTDDHSDADDSEDDGHDHEDGKGHVAEHDHTPDPLGGYVTLSGGVDTAYLGSVNRAGRWNPWYPERGNIPFSRGPLGVSGVLTLEGGVEGRWGQAFAQLQGSPGLQFEPAIGDRGTAGHGARIGGNVGARFRLIEHDGFNLALGPHIGAQYRYSNVWLTTAGVNSVFGLLGLSMDMTWKFDNGVTLSWKPYIQGGAGGGIVMNGTHQIGHTAPLIEVNLLNFAIGYSAYKPAPADEDDGEE